MLGEGQYSKGMQMGLHSGLARNANGLNENNTKQIDKNNQTKMISRTI